MYVFEAYSSYKLNHRSSDMDFTFEVIWLQTNFSKIVFLNIELPKSVCGLPAGVYGNVSKVNKKGLNSSTHQ